MRRLDLGTQSDAVARLSQAHAQLDIFHTGPGLVEAAGRRERGPPNGATAGPERARLSVTVLMDIVVEQVLEQAGRVARRRIAVVAAEQRHHIGLVRQDRLHAGQSIHVYHHVGVDKHQHVAGCRFRPAVARVRRTARASRRGQHARAQRSPLRRRSIVEPSSTTMTSSGGRDEAASPCRQRRRPSPPLWTGTMTESRRSAALMPPASRPLAREKESWAWAQRSRQVQAFADHRI